MPHRHDGHAFLLAMISAGTPAIGLRMDDVKFLLSFIASLVGSVVALYIYASGQVANAKLRRAAAEEEERRRQRLLDWEQRLVMREVEMSHALKAAAAAPPDPAG